VTNNQVDPIAQVKALADAFGESINADILIFNFEIVTPIDFMFIQTVAGRSRRKNVVLILTTEGGLADSAFRMMRFLQSNYERVTVVVPGWCKSAGTLMCIGAHEVWIGDFGELGPLDVQIVKADEMDEQKSGLAAEAAFEKLQREAFKFFMGFVRDVGASEYRVTLKTASDIATKMTIGVIQPIFDKLEPVTIGEDYRSNRLAQAYAERLNSHSKNLKRSVQFDALENLLSGYPAHGFVIDAKEAGNLFKNVKPLPDKMVEIIGLMGAEAVWPRSSRQEQGPKLEFLNDEPQQPTEQGSSAGEHGFQSGNERPGSSGNGSEQLHGNPHKRGRARPARQNGKGEEAKPA
jgi:hypothetical protein